jgi:NAD(P)-dependent dehydrogenase (short-subunit alcohol dehydrogenase family)
MGPVDFRLDGNVAIVTGAASGIGRAAAEAIAAAGAPVGLVDLTQGSTEPVAQSITAAGGRAIPLGADVTNPGQLRDAVQEVESRYGPLSLAVNSAGIANAAPAELMPL